MVSISYVIGETLRKKAQLIFCICISSAHMRTLIFFFAFSLFLFLLVFTLDGFSKFSHMCMSNGCAFHYTWTYHWAIYSRRRNFFFFFSLKPTTATVATTTTINNLTNTSNHVSRLCLYIPVLHTFKKFLVFFSTSIEVQIIVQHVNAMFVCNTHCVCARVCV